jgi:hypothetical protein
MNLLIGSRPFGDASDLTLLRASLSVLFYHNLSIGKVSRVDFVQTPASETLAYPRLSAYIHFEYWADNANARAFRAALEAPEQFRCYGTDSNHFFTRITNTGRECDAYLAMNINKRPIEVYTGPLNIHQLWAKVAYYESLEKQREEEKLNTSFLQEDAMDVDYSGFDVESFCEKMKRHYFDSAAGI